MLRIDYNIIFEIINVLILFFLFRKFLFKPVRNIMKQREDDIAKSYADAEAAKKAATDLKEQYEASVAGMEEEKKETVKQAKKDASVEYDRIITEARKKSDEILEGAQTRAKALADQEKRKAHDEIADMVKEAAARIAENESDEKLYNDFLAEVSDPAADLIEK